MVERALTGTVRLGRKVLIAVAGGAVLLTGFVMIVTPGPAFAGIAAGLGILALEFEWAERWLDFARARARAALSRLRRARAGRAA